MAGSEPSFRIVSHTLAEISSDPRLLSRYRDPAGYLARCDAGWAAMLRDNPEARGDDIVLLLTVDGDVAVGRLGLIPASVSIGSVRRRTHWIDGFYLLEDYTSAAGKKPGGFYGGVMLLRAVGVAGCLLACGAPIANLQKAYRAAGFLELGPLQRFVFFMNAGVAARRYVPAPVAAVASAAASWPLRGWYALRRGFHKPRLTYIPVETFDSTVEELMARERRHYFPKDAATLNWVLRHRPDLDAFLIRRGERPVGYCLLKRRRDPGGGIHGLPAMTVGSLLDYYLAEATPEMQRDLLAFTVDFLRRQGVDVVECQLAERGFQQVAHACGGFRIGGNKTFFRPPKEPRPAPGDEWFFTHATSDVILM